MFALAWLGFWIDGHPIGKKTSGVVWVLVVAMVCSNLGLIPLASPVYDFVGGSLVPLAIPLLLLKGDLRKIFRESGGVMIFLFDREFRHRGGCSAGILYAGSGRNRPKGSGCVHRRLDRWCG